MKNQDDKLKLGEGLIAQITKHNKTTLQTKFTKKELEEIFTRMDKVYTTTYNGFLVVKDNGDIINPYEEILKGKNSI